MPSPLYYATTIGFRVTRAFLFILAVFLLASTTYDEHRGITVPPDRFAVLGEVRKDDDPKQFRSIMTYKWIRGSLFLIAWSALVGIRRRMDKLDPFSPNFAGNAELDELGRDLDKEEKQRERHK